MVVVREHSSNNLEGQQPELQELWTTTIALINSYHDLHPTEDLKKLYLPKFAAMGVKPKELEGQEVAQCEDVYQLVRWYSGQLLSALSIDGYSNLFRQLVEGELKDNVFTLWFAQKEYFGKDLAKVIKRAEQRSQEFRRDFLNKYSASHDWMSLDEGPGKIIWDTSFRATSNHLFEDRRVALLSGDHMPDQLPVILEGVVAKLRPGELQTFHLVGDDGTVLTGKFSNAKDVRVLDDAPTSYRKQIAQLKRDGYKLYSSGDIIPAGAKLVWMRVDEAIRRIMPIHATMQENREFVPGGLAEFKVIPEDNESVHPIIWNSNFCLKYLYFRVN